MIAYRAALDVSWELVLFTSKLLAAERRRRATPKGSRALNRLLGRSSRGMISGMARFRGQLVLASVPRGWLERLVNELCETFVALEVQDGLLVSESGEAMGVRLAEGRHATVGARYQDAEASESSLTDVVLTGWDRTGELA